MKPISPDVLAELQALIERGIEIADQHRLWDVGIGLDRARIALGVVAERSAISSSRHALESTTIAP